MPIRVKYGPSQGAIGAAAYRIGQGQRADYLTERQDAQGLARRRELLQLAQMGQQRDLAEAELMDRQARAKMTDERFRWLEEQKNQRAKQEALVKGQTIAGKQHLNIAEFVSEAFARPEKGTRFMDADTGNRIRMQAARVAHDPTLTQSQRMAALQQLQAQFDALPREPDESEIDEHELSTGHRAVRTPDGKVHIINPKDTVTQIEAERQAKTQLAEAAREQKEWQRTQNEAMANTKLEQAQRQFEAKQRTGIFSDAMKFVEGQETADKATAGEGVVWKPWSAAEKHRRVMDYIRMMTEINRMLGGSGGGASSAAAPTDPVDAEIRSILGAGR